MSLGTQLQYTKLLYELVVNIYNQDIIYGHLCHAKMFNLVFQPCGCNLYVPLQHLFIFVFILVCLFVCVHA